MRTFLERTLLHRTLLVLVVLSLFLPTFALPSYVSAGSIDLAIPLGADDGSWSVYASWFSAVGNQLYLGYYSTYHECSCFGRFTGVTIPKDATITNAYLTFRSNGGYSTTPVNVKIRAIAADNASAPTTLAEATGAVRTAAQTDWSPGSWLSGALYNSPNITNVIQEMVYRAGWVSGNAIVIYVEDNGSGVGKFRAANTYEFWSAGRLKLHIDWSIPPPAPTVVTNDSPDVSYTWGNICANITAVGATNVTTRGFQWGTTTSNYTASWNETGNWGVACEFCHNITNLGCNETYYFRGFATNSAGTGYGDEESFTTDVCTAATVATHNATSVSYTYANLNGNITAIVDENCFTRGFKWDTNSGAPYVNEWHEDGDFNEGTFSYNATSLDDNQQYYFVAYATNHAGTSYGDELDFTTLAYTAPEITTQNATDVSYFTATLNADIDSVDGVNATCRGFEWGLDTGNYTWSWNETGNYGTGTFDYGLDSLLDNQLYFFRAFTINEGGTGYGGELNYTTLEALPPTVTSSNATNITHNSATTHGNITDLGGLTVTARGFEWDIDTGAPYANDWHEDGSYGVCSFNHTLTLPSATTIYWRAYATNPDGTGYSTELNFLTLPAAPTNLTATDGDFTDVVVVNWTQLPGNITGYYIFEDSNLLNTLGNVASYNDTAAPAPTITSGNATASDGISAHNVTLLLVGYSANNGTARDYYVIAFNDAGNSTASNNDTGFTSIGELEYQWYRSADDSATNFTALVGATNYTYVDTTTPTPALTIGTADASDGNSTIVVYLGLVDTEGVDGEGRHYLCALNATDAASQNSTPDRGYRGAPALTYEWWRSEGDSDQDYTGIPGATTASYNDTGGVVDPSGRYYRCLVTMGDIDEQTTNADRGYLDPGGIMIIMIFGIICLGLMIAGFVLKQAQAVLLLLAGTGWVVFGALLFTSNVEQNTALFLTGLALAFACFTWPLVFWLRGRSKLSASERDYENYKQQVLKVTHQEKTEI